MGRVAGKVVIITGAASGLGAEDAKLLAQEGAQVIVTDINKDQCASVAAGIRRALPLVHDVCDEGQWRNVIEETMSRFGRLDALVNNAGVVAFSSVVDTSIEQYRHLNSVMSEGTFLGCKHAIPAMRRSGGGTIVNISSVAAKKGFGDIAAYSAAKGAICSLTRSVAVHCQEAGYKIRCNVVLPGGHDTPMIADAMQKLSKSSALGQIEGFGLGRPIDVANLVLFLVSDESQHINGAEIVIDNAETVK